MSVILHVRFDGLDGYFMRTGASPPVFVPAPTPTRDDLERVLVEVRDCVGVWSARHASGADDFADLGALAGCAGIAIRRSLFADLGNAPADDDDEPAAPGKRSASLDGYNLQAVVRVGADDLAREKLLR